MVKISAFADEVVHDFEGQVRYLVSEKINYLEIRFVDKKNIMDLTKSELHEVRIRLDDNNLQVSAIGSPIGKVRIDEPFDKHLDQFKHAVDLAEYLSAPFIRIFSYYPPVGKNIADYRDEVMSRMQQKVQLLADRPVVIVHENETEIYGSSAENCADMARTVNSEKFKLAYDPANFVWGQNIGNNFEVSWPIMRPFVKHIHIKDWQLGKTDVASLPGEGDGQIEELLTDLAGRGYNGFLTIEPHLKLGGQFGGDTGPELFSQAVQKTRQLCDLAGIIYE